MCLKTFRTLVMASVLSCLLGLPSSTASADLVPVTDPQSPGGLDNVTRDTNTDLEWLDWTASTDRSYDDVSDLTDSGETYQGWRHATREEVKVAAVMVAATSPAQPLPAKIPSSAPKPAAATVQ